MLDQVRILSVALACVSLVGGDFLATSFFTGCSARNSLLTGRAECPAGTDVELSFRVMMSCVAHSYTPASLKLCVYSSVDDAFGGAYQISGGACVSQNPYTGSCSCPLGHQVTLVNGPMYVNSPRSYSALNFCFRPGAYRGGGVFYTGGSYRVPNPFSGGHSCPQGWSPTQGAVTARYPGQLSAQAYLSICGLTPTDGFLCPSAWPNCSTPSATASASRTSTVTHSRSPSHSRSSTWSASTSTTHTVQPTMSTSRQQSETSSAAISLTQSASVSLVVAVTSTISVSLGLSLSDEHDSMTQTAAHTSSVSASHTRSLPPSTSSTATVSKSETSASSASPTWSDYSTSVTSSQSIALSSTKTVGPGAELSVNGSAIVLASVIQVKGNEQVVALLLHGASFNWDSGDPASVAPQFVSPDSANGFAGRLAVPGPCTVFVGVHPPSEWNSTAERSGLVAYLEANMSVIPNGPHHTNLAFGPAPDLGLSVDLVLEIMFGRGCYEGPGFSPVNVTLVRIDPHTEHTQQAVPVLETSKTVGSVASVVGGLGSPVVATQASRSTAALKMIDCSVAESLDPLQSPFGVRLGDNAIAEYAGGALLNHVVLALFGLFLLLAAFIVAQARGEPFFRGCELARFPSLLAFVAMLLIEPTSMCCVVVLLHAPTAGLQTLAVLSMILLVSIPVAVFVYLRRNRAEFVYHPNWDDHRSPLLLFFFGTCKWTDRDGPHSSGFCQRFRLFFCDYRGDHPYFICVEMAVSIAIGSLEGVKLGFGRCGGVLGVLVAVLLVYVVALIAMRPYNNPFLATFGVGLAILQLFGAIFVLVGMVEGSSFAAAAAEWVAVICMWLITARSVVDVAPNAYRAFKSVRNSRVARLGDRFVSSTAVRFDIASEFLDGANGGISGGDLHNELLEKGVEMPPVTRDRSRNVDTGSSSLTSLPNDSLFCPPPVTITVDGPPPEAESPAAASMRATPPTARRRGFSLVPRQDMIRVASNDSFLNRSFASSRVRADSILNPSFASATLSPQTTATGTCDTPDDHTDPHGSFRFSEGSVSSKERSPNLRPCVSNDSFLNPSFAMQLQNDSIVRPPSPSPTPPLAPLPPVSVPCEQPPEQLRFGDAADMLQSIARDAAPAEAEEAVSLANRMRSCNEEVLRLKREVASDPSSDIGVSAAVQLAELPEGNEVLGLLTDNEAEQLACVLQRTRSLEATVLLAALRTCRLWVAERRATGANSTSGQSTQRASDTASGVDDMITPPRSEDGTVGEPRQWEAEELEID